MEILDEMELGLQINELEKSLAQKDIAIIGLSSKMIGYSPKAHNYLDEIVHSIKFRPKDLTILNTYPTYQITEEDIEDMLAGNISLKDIKKIIHEGNEQKIKKIMESKCLPNDQKIALLMRVFTGIKEKSIEKGDEKTHLRDLIQKKEEVHIFYATDAINLPKWNFQMELEQRRRNFHTIHALNPNAHLYTIGLTAPNKLPNHSEISIEQANRSYQKLASEFGAIYIDPKGLENYFKKEQKKPYLSEEGAIILSLKCLEAMYQSNVIGLKKVEVSKISFIDENDEQIAYLLKKSERRVKEMLLLRKGNDEKTQDFLTERIEEEQEKQKVYKKILEEKENI